MAARAPRGPGLVRLRVVKTRNRPAASPRQRDGGTAGRSGACRQHAALPGRVDHWLQEAQGNVIDTDIAEAGPVPDPNSPDPPDGLDSTARRARPAPRWRPPRKRREGSRISAVAWPAGPLVGSAPPAIAGLPARRLDGGVRCRAAKSPRQAEPVPREVGPPSGGGDSGFSRAEAPRMRGREKETDPRGRVAEGGPPTWLAC